MPACVGVLAAMAFGAVSASAESSLFTTAGCRTWDAPAGVSSVGISAVGARGGSDYVSGGLGDGYTATLGGLSSGSKLRVCTDVGGGGGGVAFNGNVGGDAGGGASGVSLGSDFSDPVLVAAGGGGETYGTEGGNAGEPGHTHAATDAGGGGGAGTLTEGGEGGAAHGSGEPGFPGVGFTTAGPGFGGEGASEFYEGGGGGGGGYYGGGGGGTAGGGYAGGGGGGSDFCGNGASECERHAQEGTETVAGSAPGDAQVTLTYTAASDCTSVRGAGHILPKGQEGENLRVDLNTATGGTFTTTTPSPATRFALIDLTGESCLATAGGYEFTGEGPAKAHGVKGYEMNFAFHTDGSKTYLTLEVSKDGTPVYEVTEAPLLNMGAKGVKIS